MYKWSKFLAAVKWVKNVYSYNRIFLLFSRWVMSNPYATTWTVACQAPLFGIFQARILEWVGISFSGDLSDPGIKPESPASVGSSPLSHQGSSNRILLSHKKERSSEICYNMYEPQNITLRSWPQRLHVVWLYLS